MMIVLSFLTLVYRVRAQSIPKLHLDPCPSFCHDSRTVWDIVRSSLVTLFTCTWVAVHPNVRSPTDGILARMKERAKLLLTAVIAPEVIILFAMRQWARAREVKQSAFGRERGWTHTHGFFLIMGGFMLYSSDGERPLYPLDLGNIENLIQSGAIDFPKVTEEEIRDKSKGDIISKGLVIIQTGWFIMQCIARGAERIAITELEIMTVAFAFLNLVTYIFWWNKPLNVTCPIRIVLKEGHSEPEPISRERISLVDRIGRMIFLIIPDRDVSLGIDLLQEKRVPTFYAGRIDDKSSSLLMFAEIIIAMIFGGIHCIAWSFSFPTQVEQILWRASSIAIASIPLLISISAYLVASLDIDALVGLLALFFILCFLVYLLARMGLLILPLVSLRSLPPSAFYTVRWTTFIPHV